MKQAKNGETDGRRLQQACGKSAQVSVWRNKQSALMNSQGMQKQMMMMISPLNVHLVCLR